MLSLFLDFYTEMLMRCAIEILVISLFYNVNASRPHIIVIVADDLGWNDVGFHGSTQIPTPNIDALSYSGVILNNYYVQPICTPSRSALLTGFHPVHTGLQSYTIGGSKPYGLPLNFTLLPELLNDLGYTSAHVGKWHLGFYHEAYTPLQRGFHSHYGYWTGRIDYYDHSSFESPGYWGYDFRKNMDVDREAYGKYTTDLLTDEAVHLIGNHNASQPLFLYLAHLAVHSGNVYDPLQAPSDIVDQFSYIEDKNRRIFAAMLWKLDEGVGRVVDALSDNGMLLNSVIVFTTDNGGPAAGFNQNAASNWPLKGVKASMWEGGVRGAGLIWSPLIESPGRVSQNMMQIMDWMPTLYTAAGGNSSELNLPDAIDQWDSITKSNAIPVRSGMLHNIDPSTGGSSIRDGDWKIISIPSPYGHEWDDWFGPSGRNYIKSPFSFSKRMKLVYRSLAGKAVRKIPLFKLKLGGMKRTLRNAEVLCGSIPNNVTRFCDDPNDPCLFNIASDPCEYYDLSSQFPEKVAALQTILEAYKNTTVPRLNRPTDPASNPVYWGYAWTNWKDYRSPVAEDALISPPEEDYDYLLSSLSGNY